MRYVAAYMLAALGSKGEPTAADVEKILGSVGVEVEADKVNKVVNELKGKQLEELIEEGSKKLASVPSGGAVIGGGGAAAPAASEAAPAEAKEEKKKEESEESDDDMGFGLFD